MSADQVTDKAPLHGHHPKTDESIGWLRRITTTRSPITPPQAGSHLRRRDRVLVTMAPSHRTPVKVRNLTTTISTDPSLTFPATGCPEDTYPVSFDASLIFSMRCR